MCKACLNCGKGTKNEKYCCPSCQAIYGHKIGRLNKTLSTKIIYCKKCGMEIRIKSNSDQKFCSKGCATGYRNKNTHRHPWNYRLTKETDERLLKVSEKMMGHVGFGRLSRKIIHCKNCGIEIIVPETSGQEFCSKKCVTENSWKTKREKMIHWWNDINNRIEHGKKISRAQKNVPEKDWVKKQTSEVMLDFYEKNPEIGRISADKARRIRWENPEQHILASKEMKQRWSDMEYKNRVISKVMSSCNKRPNEKENELLEVIDNLFPREFLYVGNGKMAIEGRFPDIINTGQDKIIEHFGCYWHGCPICFPDSIRKDDSIERIKYFNRFGYDCLIVWEHELELNSRENLTNKIISFVKGV